MADNKIINAFAIKYYKLYSNPLTHEREAEIGLAEQCIAFGFEMDGGHQFIDKYGDEAFYHTTGLAKVKNNITDVSILGTAILSKWRYITHWAQTSLLETDNREWFITAFDRLADITQ